MTLPLHNNIGQLYFTMTDITHMKATFQDLFLAGCSAIAAVTVQTMSLSWVKVIIDRNKTVTSPSHHQHPPLCWREIRKFLKKEMKIFRYSAMARFGDVFSNVFVLDFFRTHDFMDMRSAPLYLRTTFVWIMASAWRLMIVPIDFPRTLILKNCYSFHRYLAKLHIKSQFRIQSDLIPLYSWFMVQNYLMETTKHIDYSDNAIGATIRNSLIGFISMSAYDIYKLTVTKFGRILMLHSNYSFCAASTSLKGMYGVIFCNITQMAASSPKENMICIN